MTLVSADPTNKDIDAKTTWTHQQDEKGLPTVPSTLEVGLCTFVASEEWGFVKLVYELSLKVLTNADFDGKNLH